MNRAQLIHLINKRPVAILAHGGSIELLENMIGKLRNIDICWIGLGLFTIFEDFILHRIDETLDIVFDCSTVPEPNQNHYEDNVRIPRLKSFLMRPNYNMWATTYGVIRDVITPRAPAMLDAFGDRILQIDSLFPQDKIPHYMDVPNSITLAIATAMAGRAEKIILFGVDGWHLGENNVHTYYKPDFQKQERLDAYGVLENRGLVRDSYAFETKFGKIHEEYNLLFGDIPVINCSPFSHYTCIDRINYSDLEGLLWKKP